MLLYEDEAFFGQTPHKIRRPQNASLLISEISALRASSSSTPIFLAFFVARGFLAKVCFLRVFPLFPRDFGGSEERNNPCLFGWFSLLSQQKGKEDQGRSKPSASKSGRGNHFFGVRGGRGISVRCHNPGTL